MNEEERLSLNYYMQDLYRAMQIGDIIFEPKHSSELYNLINKLLEENQQLKKQLEKERKGRKEAMELKHKFHKDFGLLIFENYEFIKFMNKLEDILDIDKGE